MPYQPKLGDAATDLARCLNATYGNNGFKSKNFSNFYENSVQIVRNNKAKVSGDRLKLIMSCIRRAGDKNLEADKRREDLLLASNLLLKEHIKSLQLKY